MVFKMSMACSAEAIAILSNAFGATVKIKNCTFEGCYSNTTNYVVAGRNIAIERSTFANNFVTPINFKSGCFLNTSTVKGNRSSGLAGGVLISANFNNIGGSIIAGNQFGSGGADIYNNSFTPVNGAYNFIGAYIPAKGFTSSFADTTGTPAAPINPYLDTVVNWNPGDGRTRTFALTDSSAAINTSDPLLTSKDQRGYPVVGGRADKGAFEYAPACDSVTNTFTTNVSLATALLNFTPTNATKYSIRYREADSLKWQYKTVNAPAQSYNLVNLLPNTNYIWQIRSICWGGVDSSANSAENYFTTSCNLPDSVWLALHDTTRLIFRWNKMIHSSGHRLQLQNADDSLQAPLIVTVPAGDSVYLFTGLIPNTNYEFTITTLCTPDSSESLNLLAKTDSSYIPFIKVFSPNEPITYITCEPRKIYWGGQGLSSNFKIEVSYNDGVSYSMLNANYTINDFNFEYEWTPPSLDSAKCFIRITDLVNAAVTDINDSAFFIRNKPPRPQYAGDSVFTVCRGIARWLSLVPDSLRAAYLTYVWVLPPGFNGSSDSSSIRIFAPNSVASGVIQVFAYNDCDSSLVLSIPLSTETNIFWTGEFSTDWSNSSNWTCPLGPGATDNVVIPAGVPRMPIVPGGYTATIGNLTIKPNASVR
jgi:hypothetical protein